MKNKLIGAQSISATGKLQVFGKLKGATKGITIHIYEGNIVRLRAGNHSGYVAAAKLVAMNIDRVVFMKSNDIKPSPEVDTPDTEALLEIIANAGKEVSIDRIIETTIKALEKVMGSGSEKLTNDIAAKFPPTEDQGLFLDKCKEAAMNMVGKKMADQIFDPLMKK